MCFTGLFPAQKCSLFFPPYGSANLERKPQTTRADSPFGMQYGFTANTYVKKGKEVSNDFMSILWLDDMVEILALLFVFKERGKEKQGDGFFFKTFQLVQEFKVQFEHSFPRLSPGLAYSRCFCGAGFIVPSPARGHCVCMMCVLAPTEHFHRTGVVVESRMKRKAGGGERKHFSDSNINSTLTSHWSCL